MATGKGWNCFARRSTYYWPVLLLANAIIGTSDQMLGLALNYQHPCWNLSAMQGIE